MLKLFKDRKQTFECKIKIENAQLSNARARLMLSGPFMDYAFVGKVDAMGNCLVEIPPLRMLEHNDGSAILEVMVDGGYFEPLKTECDDGDVQIIKGILEGYNKLTKEDKSIFKEHIESNYKPSKKARGWAEKVFKNPKSTVASMVMYKIDNS